MGTQMTVKFGAARHTPAEISAYILRELKQQMIAELSRRSSPDLQYDVSRAIITVPAYFGLPAIEATREAGQKAGLEVTELLHEPTAAAIYYSWKHDLGDGIYMVYDLGGGTFDVSILRRAVGEFLVLGISGDNFLGGDDFDRRLAEHLRKMLVEEDYDLDLDVASDPEDRLRFNQLMALAERAKKGLSERDEFMLRDQGTLTDKSGAPVIIEMTITRATLESLIDDLLERTINCCKEALERAGQKSGITLEDIDHILLVGGSTYVPAVMKKVEQAFCAVGESQGPRARCASPIRDEPETAVALGAALRAAAAGVGVSDESNLVRLWFRGSAATKREQATISGHLEPLEGALSLEGGRLRLITATGEVIGEVELKEGLRFAFPTVPLEAETLNEFRCEVRDSAGKQVAVLGRSIAHASDQKESVGRALSTSVLSKPIVLEGADGDRLVRQVLLGEGTSLPTRSRFTFGVGDPTGRIRLPIYQENRIIKELQVNVGQVAVGTPVDVEIACDEQVRIHVRFSIGDKEFGGNIEPPPPDSVPSEYDIQKIEQRFLDVLSRLDEADAARLLASYETARRDLNEALAGADYPKVIQRTADLEGLVRDARLAEPLRPPLEATEKNFRSCLELIPQAISIKPDLPVDSLKQDLDSAFEMAKAAYERRDHQTYHDATHVIDTALQFLVSATRKKIIDDPDLDVAVRASMAVMEAREMTQFLLVNCLIAGRAEFFAELKQQIGELDSMEARVESEPIDVLNRCQVMKTEARRIYQQIAPQEKRNADLDGLLQVGKQNPSGLDVGNLFDKG
jgi:molecular chaperone DnaK